MSSESPSATSGRDERHALDQAHVVARHERQHDGAHERRRDEQRQDGQPGQVEAHRVVTSRRLAAMTMRPPAMPSA